MKECSLCGEMMRLSVREVQGPAGNAGPLHVIREWICPECDYFEDAEPGEG